MNRYSSWKVAFGLVISVLLVIYIINETEEQVYIPKKTSESYRPKEEIIQIEDGKKGVASLLNNLKPQQLQSSISSFNLEEKRIVGVLSHFGGSLPKHFPLVVQLAKRSSPRLFILIVSIESEPLLCPRGTESSRIEENVRFACLSEEEMTQRFSDSMCLHWECTDDEIESVSSAVKRILKGDSANLLQLFIPDALKDLMSFPDVKEGFNFWLRMDKDTLIGDLDWFFPWTLLDTFDVISFGSVKWKQIYFPVGTTVFRISNKVNAAWMDIEGLQNPVSFVKNVDDPNRTWRSQIEGGLARSITHINGELTFVSFAKARQLSGFNKWGNHLDIRGSKYHNMIVSAKSDEEILVLHKLKVKAPDFDGPPINRLGRVRVHSTCPEMNWINQEETSASNEANGVEEASNNNNNNENDQNSIPFRSFLKKQSKRVKKEGDETQSYSSEDGELEEDEEYQVLQETIPSRRKRSRSTPNPGPDSLVFLPSFPAEAPAILSGGAKKTRLCEFCNASDTPMWRRGPSGKGTLCNACGVKWSLNLRKRNSKKDSGVSNGDKHNGNGHSRRSPAHKSQAETKPKRKGIKKGDGDEDFMEESGEDSPAEASKEYFCTYCGMSWPFGYFKNIQQFGAHCSNCSRKHGKAEGSEEPLIKKVKTDVSIEVNPAETLSGLLDAVENQLLEETTDSPRVQRSPPQLVGDSNGQNGTENSNHHHVHSTREERGQEETRKRHLAEAKVSLLEEFNELKRDITAYTSSKEELSQSIEKISKEMSSRLNEELSEILRQTLSKENGQPENLPSENNQTNGHSNGKHDTELAILLQSKINSFVKDLVTKVEEESINMTNVLEENPLIGTENGNRRRFTRNTSLASQNLNRLDKFYHTLQHVLSISK